MAVFWRGMRHEPHPVVRRNVSGTLHLRTHAAAAAAANLRTIVVSSGDIDPVVSLHGTGASLSS
jgi:hypothetical protein